MNNQKLNIKFETIYRETYDNTLRYIISKCSNIDDVNEIIQETYLEIYRALRKKKSIINYQAYIISIAKNKIKDYIDMKQKTNNISIIQFNNDEEYIVDLDANIDIEADFIDKSNVDKIWQYIKSMDEDVSKIFYFHIIENMTFKEISEKLEINESTIKSIFYRMLKNIKKLYLGGENIEK